MRWYISLHHVCPKDHAHTNKQYTHAQVVFGPDSILNRIHDVNWEAVKERKQASINKHNVQENKTHKPTHIKHVTRSYSKTCGKLILTKMPTWVSM